VHSKVQIIASVASGGKSLLQHSQLGLNSSKRYPLCLNAAAHANGLLSYYFFAIGS
jgi:hypothetical protein